MSENSDPYLVVGNFAGAFGVKGWIKIHSLTQPFDSILNYSPWYIEQTKQWVPAPIKEAKLHGQGVVALVEGYESRETVNALSGKKIAVKRSQLPETATNEYYWSDLEGLTVLTVEGQTLGKISHLFETGSNDVMVITGNKQRHLIPFLREKVIINVDLEKRQIVVNWDLEL